MEWKKSKNGKHATGSFSCMLWYTRLLSTYKEGVLSPEWKIQLVNPFRVKFFSLIIPMPIIVSFKEICSCTSSTYSLIIVCSEFTN